MKNLNSILLILLFSLSAFAEDFKVNYAAKSYESLEKPVTKTSTADPKVMPTQQALTVDDYNNFIFTAKSRKTGIWKIWKRNAQGIYTGIFNDKYCRIHVHVSNDKSTLTYVKYKPNTNFDPRNGAATPMPTSTLDSSWLCRSNFDGTAEMKLLLIPNFNRDGVYSLDVSPDQTKILFTTGNDRYPVASTRDGDVFLYNVATRVLTNLTNDWDLWEKVAKFSIDGNKVIFDKCPNGWFGWPNDIYQLDLQTNQVSKLSSASGYSGQDQVCRLASITKTGRILFNRLGGGSLRRLRSNRTDSIIYNQAPLQGVLEISNDMYAAAGAPFTADSTYLNIITSGALLGKIRFDSISNFRGDYRFNGNGEEVSDFKWLGFWQSCTTPSTPTITASSATTFCTGGSVNLTAPAGFSYLWSNNATTQNITVNASGSYTVRTIANGCTSAASAATVVNVITPPTTPTITASGATTFCTGGSVTLTAPAGFTYLWSNNAATQSITVSTSGSYTVRTIANGCTSATSAATAVNAINLTTPSIAVTSGITTLFPGKTVTLTAPAGFSYLWSNNATTQSITVNAAGSFTVRTIASGCTSAVSAAVTTTTQPNFEFYADTVYSKPGGVVSVPVRVRGFSGILGMQSEITLPTGTTYQSINNLNATLGLSLAGNFGLAAIGQNKLYFTWDDQVGLARTLSNGAVLFNIDLNVGPNVTPGSVLPIQFPNANSQIVISLGSLVRVPNANIILRQGAVIVKGLISGKIVTRTNTTVPGVRLNVKGAAEDTLVASNGTYALSCPANSSLVVSPRKTNDINRLNGIDILDMVMVRSHILGSTTLNNAYRALAADVDRSNSVTTSDINLIRDLILRNRTTFPQSRSWLFVRSNQTFANQNNPWPVDTFRTYATVPGNAIDQDFVACKLGDVDGSYDNSVARVGTSQLQAVLRLNRATITRSGDTATISMTLSGAASSGIQFTTQWDSTKVRFAGIASMYAGTYYANINKGTLTVLSSNLAGGLLPRNLNLITIKLIALAGLADSALVKITSNVATLACYDSLLTAMQVNITEGKVVKLVTTGLGQQNSMSSFTLHPNPASTSVQLRINDGDIKQAEVIDQLGRTVINSQHLPDNILDISGLPAGTYMVRAITNKGVVVRKMIKE